MSKIKAICVYCGSSPGTDPAYIQAARAFGKILAENTYGSSMAGALLG